MPRLKQTLLSFPTSTSGDSADDMERAAGDEFSDGFVTPAEGSQVAVVIYTPNKTHLLQDVAPSHLPTPKQSRQGAARARKDRTMVAQNASIPSERDHAQDPRLQSPTSGPQLRRTRARKNLTPLQEPRPKRGGTRRGQPQNRTQPKDSSLDNAIDGSDPMDTSPHAFVSPDIDPTGDSEGESEEPETPSRNRRSINTRSFISGGASGKALVPPSQLSKERAIQTRSKKPMSKSPVNAIVAPSSLRSTRSRAKAEKLAATQGKHGLEERDIPATREGSKRSGNFPASGERTGHAGETSTGKPEKRLGGQDEADEDEDVVSRSKRRRMRFTNSSAGSDRGENSQKKGEVEDEGQDGGENSEVLRANPSTGPRTRNRGGTVKPRVTRTQKLLEELKNRRAGLSSAKDAVLSSSPETPDTPKRGIYDTETEDESKFLDDELDEESGTEAIRKSLRSGRRDEYDTDFVVSDDEGDIGAPSSGPGRLDIPIEFTHRAHKKLKEHFSDAIEWMVHNKLNPAFDRKDPVYRIAFQRLDSEAATYSSSKFESSIWTQDFTRALKARPEFYKTAITSYDQDCEACNRKKHTATYKVQFSGKPYHHDSLEEISSFSENDDDDDDDGDDDLENDYDSRGNALPDPEAVYYVGRVCYLNAEAAHALTHWRYHLNEWVIDELHRRGLFDPTAILARESWNTKRRGAYANGIMKQLQESGEIARLYQDFKNNLNEACNAKVLKTRVWSEFDAHIAKYVVSSLTDGGQSERRMIRQPEWT
ncbi:hypothetical protein FGG08_006503 [Glutinoglossum americanum]|uniref:DUF4211 domain-containing protein n=1 Tax=Glutinoglossum americanum TaxID=1670608 RepID=A0A9P8I150_9PEZI|nr:hypothetical protein FGG08_006503 [Glutinoglossum americanum]